MLDRVRLQISENCEREHVGTWSEWNGDQLLWGERCRNSCGKKASAIHLHTSRMSAANVDFCVN
jgi:hypothetical protein